MNALTQLSLEQRLDSVATQVKQQAVSSRYELEAAINLAYQTNPIGIVRYIAEVLEGRPDAHKMLLDVVLQSVASHHKDALISRVGRSQEAFAQTSNNYAETRGA